VLLGRAMPAIRATVWLACLALGPACAPASDDTGGVGSATAHATEYATVLEAAKKSCSSASVRRLARQIAAESSCIEPGAFSHVPELANVSWGPHVNAQLEQPARDRFVKALKSKPALGMTVNSMLRTVAEQYALHHWYKSGRCGIKLASSPGKSAHETGLAVDVAEQASWRKALAKQGFAWFGGGDPVHFDFVGPGAVDHRGLDVLAFQRLWNRNHPAAPLVEDGAYGGAVASRLKQAPPGGFALGPSCGGIVDASCDAAFADICDTPNRADIEWLAQKGLTKGCGFAEGRTIYCPSDVVTREQIAHFLAGLLSLPAGPDAFVDDEDSPFEADIDAAAAAGIVGGCSSVGPKFCPDERLSRAEAASLLARAFKLAPGPDAFVDDTGSPHEADINALAAAGIAVGCDAEAHLFCPDAPVTRAQIATLLHRAVP
jgi:hypothetical protein